MGYKTDFSGSFKLNKPLTVAHQRYLTKFAETRRMQRDPRKLPYDEVREAVKLKAGPEGSYFVGGGGSFGQDKDSSIINYNTPPVGQPGLWCNWIPNKDGTAIQWNGGEKFYNYVEWIEYIIKHFLAPAGYVLNGEVEWEGEENSDMGKIIIEDNVVVVKHANISWVY